MALALQCPDCGHKMPLGDVAGDTFRCGECGRALKKPSQYAATGAAPHGRRAAAAAAAAETPSEPATRAQRAVSVDATAAVPKVAAAAPSAAPGGSARPARPARPAPPVVLRILLWVVGLPLGVFLALGIANALGWLTRDQLEDTLLKDDWSRFVPILRILPLAAILAAAIVHFGAMGLAWWRDPSRPRRSKAPTSA